MRCKQGNGVNANLSLTTTLDRLLDFHCLPNDPEFPGPYLVTPDLLCISADVWDGRFSMAQPRERAQSLQNTFREDL
jgi:hypothetical protein